VVDTTSIADTPPSGTTRRRGGQLQTAEHVPPPRVVPPPTRESAIGDECHAYATVLDGTDPGFDEFAAIAATQLLLAGAKLAYLERHTGLPPLSPADLAHLDQQLQADADRRAADAALRGWTE
jgi:hypothetical protein